MSFLRKRSFPNTVPILLVCLLCLLLRLKESWNGAIRAWRVPSVLSTVSGVSSATSRVSWPKRSPAMILQNWMKLIKSCAACCIIRSKKLPTISSSGLISILQSVRWWSWSMLYMFIRKLRKITMPVWFMKPFPLCCGCLLLSYRT